MMVGEEEVVVVVVGRTWPHNISQAYHHTDTYAWLCMITFVSTISQKTSLPKAEKLARLPSRRRGAPRWRNRTPKLHPRFFAHYIEHKALVSGRDKLSSLSPSSLSPSSPFSQSRWSTFCLHSAWTLWTLPREGLSSSDCDLEPPLSPRYPFHRIPQKLIFLPKANLQPNTTTIIMMMIPCLPFRIRLRIALLISKSPRSHLRNPW